jgi:ABC-type transporter Mla subunit MlaD
LAIIRQLYREPLSITLTMPPKGGDSQTLRIMAETTISVTDALRGQQDQLRRLIAQKQLISESTSSSLSEIEAQIVELKRLLSELEEAVKGHLKKGQ